MKKIIIPFIFTLFITVTNAQSFGIRAGADFATLRAKLQGYSLSTNETGFYVGAFKTFNLSESIKIRPEVNYIIIKDLDQLQIPILVVIGLTNKFDILAGVSANFLSDDDDNSKPFDFALEFGLAYQIIEHLSVETRYSLGLLNLDESNYGFNSTIKLSGFFVGLGYHF